MKSKLKVVIYTPKACTSSSPSQRLVLPKSKSPKNLAIYRSALSKNMMGTSSVIQGVTDLKLSLLLELERSQDASCCFGTLTHG